MKVLLRTYWEHLRSSYWFVPTVMAVTAIVSSFLSIEVDRSFRYVILRQQGWIYTGGAEGARAVLSTIAGSIITVAGTTFSIIIAALSLASAQFGPRLLRNFMRDTGNQVVLGTFTSTFIYCLLVLRTVRGLEDNTYVPHISVTIAVALALTSLGVLIFFIHHAAESIQVSHVIEVVGEELQDSVVRLFPGRIGIPSEPEIAEISDGGASILARAEGYLQTVDESELLRIATSRNILIALKVRPGDFLIPGKITAIAIPDIDQAGAIDVLAAFSLGRTRTSHQDAVFAFLQLSEIGMRALSPGVNDPFTAIMCIDRITSAMCRLTERSLPPATRCDSTGVVRVVARPYNFENLVEAGYRHIRESAAGQWQVRRHLQDQIRYLLSQVHDETFRRALEKELACLS